MAYTTPGDFTRTQSIIENTDLQITITATAETGGIRIVYSVMNINGSGNPDISNLTMTNYFEAHPGGVTQNNVGTLQYSSVATLEGTVVSGLLSEGGGVCGGWGAVGESNCTTPTAHNIGDQGTGAGSTYKLINDGGLFNGTNSASNPASGAMKWYYGDLAGGDTADFTLELVPEPGTWSLLSLGAGLMFAAWRRRRA